MKQPRVLLRIESPALRNQIINLPAMCRAEVVTLNNDEAFFDLVSENGHDLLVFEIQPEVDEKLNNFIIPANCNCIFISDGTPTPNLDAIMEKTAGYHFRAPYEFEMINASIKDFLNDTENTLDDREEVYSKLDQFGLLVGSAPSMRKLYRTIHKISPSEASVFIIGESGVGKELVARTIHAMSERAENDFIAINCGAISSELADSDLFGHVKGAYTGASHSRSGVFDRAKNGTLFLDEVTEMPIELQVKLLRVLETEEFIPVGGETTQKTNVRILAASNRDPQDALASGHLREDLYFRLAQIPLVIPNLKSRGSDISGLAEHFISYLNEENNTSVKLSSEAMKKLQEYDWPGNVRELKHTVNRAYLLAKDLISNNDIIFDATLKSSDSTPTPNIPAGFPLDELEQLAIEKTLEKNNGNKTETAEQLGISVKTLYNKLDKYQQ